MKAYALVFVGGGLGSLLRYAAGRWVPTVPLGVPFPLAILIVNVVASAILGAATGWVMSRAAGEEVRLLIGVGFCGGLSTFSSFSYDTLILLQNGRLLAALVNVGLNVLLCLAASFGGLSVGLKQ